MDFCPAGELFFHLHNLGRLTEDQAKFYFSEIILGIEYLHSLEIVYRDLKPENILLDIDGHVRITDFGLSKQGISKDSRSFSFCGSPEYMSPEMLKGLGHGREVDFYSIGALLFEMLTGLPPFYDANRSRMYIKILNEDLEMPTYLSKSAKQLIAGLLEKDPTRRLGCSEGIEEIKSHLWLKGTDYKRILQKKISPPFRPNLHHSNFDPEYTVTPISHDEFLTSPTPFASPFEDFDYAYHGKVSKEIKLHSVDLASLSTNISKTGYFSRNNSHSKLSLILEDDEVAKTAEEVKKPKFTLAANAKKTIISMPNSFNSACGKKKIVDETENPVFRQKTSVAGQKVYLVKRNNKKD